MQIWQISSQTMTHVSSTYYQVMTWFVRFVSLVLSDFFSFTTRRIMLHVENIPKRTMQVSIFASCQIITVIYGLQSMLQTLRDRLMVCTSIIQTASHTLFVRGMKILLMTIAHKSMDTQLTGLLLMQPRDISMKSASGVENVIQVLSHI